MVLITFLCAGYLLIPPSTAGFDRFEIFVDQQLYGTVLPLTGPAEVCVGDNRPHTVTIWALFTNGSRVEVQDETLPRIIQADVPQPRPAFMPHPDLDRNGIVGISDFGIFARSFGQCVDWDAGGVPVLCSQR